MCASISRLDQLREDAGTGRLSRRDVLKRGVALGLSAPVLAGLLAACGSDNNDATNTAPAADTVASGGSGATTTTGSTSASPTVPGGASPVAGATHTTGTAATTPTTASAEGGQRGGSGLLRLIYWQAPTILNPHLANGTKDLHAARVCLEPLVDFDSDLNPILALATEYPSLENGSLAADGKSVTWKLRQGVKWHDGEDFTAADVKFTWEFATNPDTPATTSGTYSIIESIDIVDDYTVTLHFKAPNPFWYDPFTGSYGVILPQHAFKDHLGADAPNAPANLQAIGTGPFKVKEFKPGDVVNYELFEDYWDPGKPHIDQIELKGGGDAAGAARAVLQSGEADWAWNLQIAPQVLDDMLKDAQGELATLSGGGTERLMIQEADPTQETYGAKAEPSTKHPIFSNVNARKAIALACQRDVITSSCMGRVAKSPPTSTTSQRKFTDPNISWEYNLDKARTAQGHPSSPGLQAALPDLDQRCAPEDAGDHQGGAGRTGL